MNTNNGAVRIYARVGHHGQLIKVATVVVDGLDGPARTEHVAETLEQLAAKIRLDGKFLDIVHEGSK